MRKGDKLGDIEVVDISERKVVLQWRSEKIPLSMERIKTLGSSAPAKGNAGAVQNVPTYRTRRRLGSATQGVAPAPAVPENVEPPDDDDE
jgi:hypothetical protein